MPRRNAAQSATWQEIAGPHFLLVEGADDKQLFLALFRSIGIESVQVEQCGGSPRMRGAIGLISSDRNLHKIRRLGFVRDADDDPAAAFRSVQAALRDYDLPIPDSPVDPTDQSAELAVGVMILPAPNQLGMLETLLAQSFADTPIDECVSAFLACAAISGDAALKRPEKSRMNAFLSAMPDPNISVGIAAQKGYWNFDHSCFDPVKDFLRDLFAETEKAASTPQPAIR